ncbi:MAG: glycosyltransferase [Dechloromonas sp.]|nr:glycosyltransferase [Dechloromonas sp.]
MNVLIFTGFYLPGFKGGGPIKTVANLVSTTSGRINYSIITGDRDLGDSKPYSNVVPDCWCSDGPTSIYYCSPTVFAYLRVLWEVFNKKYDVVYLNSFLSPFFSFFPLLAAKLGRKKVVLGPRGEFSLGAMEIKAIKKKIFIFFFRMLGLCKGILFQASTKFEADDIKRVLGEGVDIFVAEDIALFEAPLNVPMKSSGCLRLVFVSRISPKKNISYALELLKDVKANVSYHIFGPIEDADYWRMCEVIIASLPENVEVKYCGNLDPAEVVKTISQYDIFFMPTKGENYGHVIAEALCAGLPIVVSDTTPWRNLQENGIGWDIPLDKPDLFVQAIEQAANMTEAEYLRFRDRVLSWASKKFSQTDAIEANIAMFCNVLGK